MDTGLKSDFNKLRIKLSEIASLQLENLNRKSRQLQRAIARDLRTQDCIYMSEVDAPHFMDFLYPPPTNCFDRRQPFNPVEVVNLDWNDYMIERTANQAGAWLRIKWTASLVFGVRWVQLGNTNVREPHSLVKK